MTRLVLSLFLVVSLGSACGVDDAQLADTEAADAIATTSQELVTSKKTCTEAFPWGTGIWIGKYGCTNLSGYITCYGNPLTSAECTAFCTTTCQRPGVHSFRNTTSTVPLSICLCK